MILVTGSGGLVGTDLIEVLKKNPQNQVISVDIMGNYDQKIDIRNLQQLKLLFRKYQFNQIFHLAGLLSVGSEKNPNLAWEVNLGGLKNILDLAVEHKSQVFWPSSIASFGPTTPKTNTPQHTILEPTTIYGTTKVAGELLCQYYFLKYGVDVRSLRYPGLIAWKAPPGDGTTEYSVHIFHQALKTGHYTCFLKADTRLPMMYIDDAISGTLLLMSVPKEKISIRTSYNFSGLNFTPAELVIKITKLLPNFTCDYAPDYRQIIADSWPQSIDDSVAGSDWVWQPKFDLQKLTQSMFDNLKSQYAAD